MRIERVRIDAFGRLREFDSGARPLGELVVVLGPNEAGKSTLFSFLTTALYGFHPASRERNPHIPWGSEEASGRIEVTLSDGQCVHVERRLRSSPSGRLTASGVTTELRNHPVPWATAVPRTVFRQVFAVTLADLAGLDVETWARIQDRLVGSMGSSDLGSARTVAEGLEREASELWRPNRRGNQLIRDLQAEIRALRSRRTGALERDRSIRGLVEERDNAQVRLREMRSERQQHRVAVERVQTLLPVKRQLARVRALRQQGGPEDELRGLPPDPPGALNELEADQQRLEDRVNALDAEMREPDETIARFDAATRALLAKGDEVTAFVALAAEVAPDRRKARELRAELEEIRRGREAGAGNLLTDGWQEAVRDRLRTFSVALLRDRIERLRAADSLRSDTGMMEPERPHAPWTLGASVAGGVAGAALLAWGLVGGPTAAPILGAALATGGAIGAVLASRGRRKGGDSESEPGPGTEPALDEISAMVDGLSVLPQYLDPPGEPLSEGIARLQRLVLTEDDRRGALEAAEARVAEADQVGRRLAAGLGKNGEGGAEGLAPVLDRELRDAERRRDAATSADREARRLKRERDGARQDLTVVSERASALRAALAEMGGGSATRGAQAAKSRIEDHRRADQLTDEMERSHPDLPELKAQIESAEEAGDPWTMGDGDLARRRAHIEELDGQIESLIAEVEALGRNAEHLRDMETVDAVDGEIATLQETEARLMRKRDRKWALAQLLRAADRRFREEHQPDLLRRAGAHLEHLTGGRYDRLLVDEAHDEGLFQIVGPGLPAPIPLAPPVSTGTLEQAYLSIRLAIVDHLDDGRERLPLFIDEAFVNWDRTRRERGLDVLADLSATRQLFVFTCYPEIATRLESRGARRIELEQGP